METREYVEYLLKNYNEILKELEQLKYEYESYKDIDGDEVIEAMNFTSSSEEHVQTNSISDKTCKIALIYNEAAKRMNRESRQEIYRMIRATEMEMGRLDYCIERLDENVKNVINLIFKDKESIYSIAKNLSIAERTVCNYRRKGTDDIIKMFDIKRLVV